MDAQKSKPRKACDLCYRKRIKCDGKIPRCSQCQIYDCQCTHQAASRRKKRPGSCSVQLPESVAIVGNTTTGSFSQNESMHVPRNKNHDSHSIPAGPRDEGQDALPTGDVSRLFPSNDSSSLDALHADSFGLPWDADSTYLDTSTSIHLLLPAEALVRPLIDTYLAEFNSLLPLFDPYQLTRMVDQWYRSPTQRTRTSWAVINVVMAMSQYCTTGQLERGSANASTGNSVSDCLGNAQSALTELLMGDVQLANLQVVLGLVIIFKATSDFKPAVFLIPTALRLCQSMGLHRSNSDIYRNASHRDALQYTRVFWIAYILDRDLALRIQQAPVQQDADISIELPSMIMDEDAAGFLSPSETQRDGFNIFRALVELAQIQGYVYDALFSVRAERISSGERAANSQAIRLMLKEWKDRIPAALTAKTLALTPSLLPCISNLICALYGTVVSCLGLLCQVNAMDFHWINQLRDYGHSITAGLHPRVPPPQPQGWNALVSECREFMPLFTSVQNKGPAFIWTNICPFASSLICLSANAIINFDNRDSVADIDVRLRREAVDILGEMKRQTNHKTLAKVLEAVTELDSQYRLMTST